MTNEKREIGMNFMDLDEETGSECSSNKKRKLESSAKNKKKKARKTVNIIESDPNDDTEGQYCWICHCSDSSMKCMFCPRVYHPNCIDGQTFDVNAFSSLINLSSLSGSGMNYSSNSSSIAIPNNINNSSQGNNSNNNKNQNGMMREFICPECVFSMMGDCNQHGRLSIQVIPQDDLREMMMYIVLRLFHYNGEADDAPALAKYYQALHFQDAVDDKNYRDYSKLIKHPMNLKLLKKKIDEGCYNSIQQFTSDFKWIYHNCVVYNGDNYITSCAHNLISLGLKEINFMESCPHCFQIRLPFMVRWLKDLDYGGSSSSGIGGLHGPKAKMSWRFSFDNRSIQKMWITELCDTIHPLVWVRLQGYPTWPGKLLCIDDDTALILFFGDYDLNTVPLGSMSIHTQSNSKQLHVANNQGNSEDGSKKNKSFSNALNTSNRNNGDHTDSSSEVLKEYKLALEQMNLHIENIKQRYTGFTVPPKKYENNITRGIDYYKKYVRRKQRQTENFSNVSANIYNDNNSVSGHQKSSRLLNNSNNNEQIKNGVQPKIESIVEKNPKFTVSKSGSKLNPDKFIENFEMGFNKLLERFKIEYKEVMDIHSDEQVVKKQPQLNHTQETTALSSRNPSNSSALLPNSQIESHKPSNDNIDIDNQGVAESQEVVKETVSSETIPKIEEQKIAIIEKEPDQEKIELIKYIRYLEEKLHLSDSEIKRQELLGSLRYEELNLETRVQQKEVRKVLENDFRNTMIQASQKFKKNEWCAYCGKTALFFCCWNTCYCNSECQINHWMIHKSHCAQMTKKTSNSNSNHTSSSPAATTITTNNNNNNNPSPIVSSVPITTVTVAPSNRSSSITTSNPSQQIQPNTQSNLNSISYHHQQQQQQQQMMQYQNAPSNLPNNNNHNTNNTNVYQHRSMLNGNMPITNSSSNPIISNQNNSNNNNTNINNGVIVGPITNNSANSNILTNSLLTAINHRNIVGAQIQQQQQQHLQSHQQQQLTPQQSAQPQIPGVGSHHFLPNYGHNRSIR